MSGVWGKSVFDNKYHLYQKDKHSNVIYIPVCDKYRYARSDFPLISHEGNENLPERLCCKKCLALLEEVA